MPTLASDFEVISRNVLKKTWIAAKLSIASLRMGRINRDMQNTEVLSVIGYSG
jgi:hypothetical protein